jgi:hypothetical protein
LALGPTVYDRFALILRAGLLKAEGEPPLSRT